MQALTIPSHIRCRQCGASPSEASPLEMRETDDYFGLPSYVVVCVDKEACRARYSKASEHRIRAYA